MDSNRNFMLPPIEDHVRRRLDEAVRRVEIEQERSRNVTEPATVKRTSFAWMDRPS